MSFSDYNSPEEELGIGELAQWEAPAEGDVDPEMDA